MASFKNPIATNAILSDINQIRDLFSYLAKMNPSLGTDVPSGAFRVYEVTAGKKWRLEKYNGSSWAALTEIEGSIDKIGGYAPSTTAKANTIPVYNSSGQLVGNITGNAPTSTKWAGKIKIQTGGISASTAQDMDGSGDVTIPINTITVNNSADTALNGIVTPAHGGTGRNDGAAADVIVDSVSGQVKAKDYGQIGPAKTVNNTVNLDTYVVDGTYFFRGTNSSGAANHWPVPGDVVNTTLYVHYESGGNLKQILIGGAGGGAWRRTSTNKGASWSGWVPLCYCTSTVIYISKSGNDDYVGLDSGYPVLTFARAMQIAHGIVGSNSSQPIIYFNFGQGDWGNITIRDCPFLVVFRPYDGGTATAYSVSLPTFGNITVEYSYFIFQSSIAGIIRATKNACVTINNGFKRVNGVRGDNNGSIIFSSQNDATNIIEFTGGANTPLQADKGGMIYAEYIHFKLSGNITTRFLYAATSGRIDFVNGRTVYDSSSFTSTGRKYELASGAIFNSSQDPGVVTWLDALPGNQAGTIATSCIINGGARGNLSTNGGTLTGKLTIRTTSPILSLYDTGLSRASKPSADLSRNFVEMYDAENARLGTLVGKYTTAQATLFGLSAQMAVSGSNKIAEIGSMVTSTGTTTGYAPTPADTSNDTSIATTAWVRKYTDSYLSSGAGTISNATLANATMSSGTINATNVTLTSVPGYTDSSAKIPSTSWVHNICGNKYYGMCPSASSVVRSNNTTYTAESNGWFFVNMSSEGEQYTKKVYLNGIIIYDHSLWAGAMGVVTPVQYLMSYRFESSTNVSSGFFKPAIDANSFYGSRSISQNMRNNNSGFGSIFLAIVGGDKVEAFGDLISVANYLELGVPDPRQVELDPQYLTDFYNESIAKINEDYEKGIDETNAHFEEELKLALFDNERMIKALYKERGADAFDIPYDEEMALSERIIRRQIASQKGTQLVLLTERKKKAYEELNKTMIVKQSEYEDELQKKIDEAYRLLDAVCEKAMRMADMVISVETWEEYDCVAHVVDGKIVLGHTTEEFENMITRQSEKYLDKCSQAIARLELEKRVASRAARRNRISASEYAAKEELIDARIDQWDTYAAEIMDMPNQRGYPWDGGGRITPWPKEPA